MKSPDPASLQNLNDIVLPAQVSWWPLATGWYILSALLFIVLAWLGYQSLRRWFKNRYRRVALQELQSLADGMQSREDRDSSLRQIPILLKRTALAAYPRNQVASLSGEDWHHFLNSRLKNPTFSESVADSLDMISYASGKLSGIDDQATTALLHASRHWLKHHRPATVSKASKEP